MQDPVKEQSLIVNVPSLEVRACWLKQTMLKTQAILSSNVFLRVSGHTGENPTSSVNVQCPKIEEEARIVIQGAQNWQKSGLLDKDCQGAISPVPPSSSTQDAQRDVK